MEDVDDVDDIEEDELLRWRLFLGMNIRSSGAPTWPPVRLAQGPDRLCCGKFGGLATAVMRDEQPDQAGRLSGDSRASVQAEIFPKWSLSLLGDSKLRKSCPSRDRGRFGDDGPRSTVWALSCAWLCVAPSAEVFR